MVWRYSTEPSAHFDFYFSSAFNVPQNSLGINTFRLIALANYAVRDAPIRLFCRSDGGEVVEAKIKDMGGPEECLWHDIFVDCDFQVRSSVATIFGDTNAEEMIISESQVEKIYPLVVCYPRMFYFENWQTFLISIEVYRHFGVNRFSIPIVSVIEELYTILEHYEHHGLVKLKEGVVLPLIQNQNPNTQTDFFNQMIHQHECLYENQESEFIVFVDVDDLIIPRDHSTLFEELRGHSQRFPLASSFEFLWSRFNVPKVKHPNEFNIQEFLLQVHYAEDDETVGKSAVRPQRLNAGLMHRPFFPKREINGNFTHIVLDSNSTRTIHLRSRMDAFENRTSTTYFQALEFSGITDHLRWFLSLNHHVYQVFLRLPTALDFLTKMIECARRIDLEMIERRLTGCPNPLQCEDQLRPIKRSCTVVKHVYQTVELQTACPTCILTLHSSVKKNLQIQQSCSVY
ncbi:Glycosyltransferase family 92 protein [Aphelenchoides besseyi]|nr:Glycosyltransferase family 92 protein [Aphelenchoides besseyi]KAI6195324.1 Glycosyltransferase family 92 protein [Aphelenchoides besseyi]